MSRCRRSCSPSSACCEARVSFRAEAAERPRHGCACCWALVTAERCAEQGRSNEQPSEPDRSSRWNAANLRGGSDSQVRQAICEMPRQCAVRASAYCVGPSANRSLSDEGVWPGARLPRPSRSVIRWMDTLRTPSTCTATLATKPALEFPHICETLADACPASSSTLSRARDATPRASRSSSLRSARCSSPHPSGGGRQ